MWWIQKKYVKVLQKLKKLISWTSFILLKLLIVMWSRIFYVLFYIINIIIWLQRQMLQYLWLCDTNHLKREELSKREGGREKERERKEGEREGQNLHPDELHFPPSQIRGQCSVFLKATIPFLSKVRENSVHLFLSWLYEHRGTTMSLVLLVSANPFAF